MKSIVFDIRNYDTNVPMDDYDIICVEEIQNKYDTVACSFVTADVVDRIRLHRVKIKFEWLDSATNLTVDNFLFVQESNMLFFNSPYQWGVIDIANKILKRREDAFYLPTIYRYDNFILVHDELYAESVKYNGERIDNVPIDPPYEMKEYEDRIEYNSPVYGHHILKTC
ncbi:MAG: hypothetical protein EOO45_23365 [Flavobacterium sp.]|nr:MAG: hypothetical protein EOO45_23365 [Flavobacterium sp.]